MQPGPSYKKGLLIALFAYFIWGVFPLYWKMIEHIPAMQILAHRILWAFVFLAIIIFIGRNKNFRNYVKNKKVMMLLTISATLVAANWGIYIYAVNNHHIVEASLGYYINPIVNVMLGMIFLKERLNNVQIAALLFALAGIAWLTFSVGKLPIISLLLAFTFGFYALIRKQANLQSMPGLLIETMVLVPVALTYLLFKAKSGVGAFLSGSMQDDIFLIIAGPVTAIPLFLFGIAAPKIPLSTMGFIQYLSPTIQLLIGVVLFNEHFTHANLVCFILVWTGLALYSYSVVKQIRENSLHKK